MGTDLVCRLPRRLGRLRRIANGGRPPEQPSNPRLRNRYFSHSVFLNCGIRRLKIPPPTQEAWHGFAIHHRRISVQLLPNPWSLLSPRFCSDGAASDVLMIIAGTNLRRVSSSLLIFLFSFPCEFAFGSVILTSAEAFSVPALANQHLGSGKHQSCTSSRRLRL